MYYIPSQAVKTAESENNSTLRRCKVVLCQWMEQFFPFCLHVAINIVKRFAIVIQHKLLGPLC